VEDRGGFTSEMMHEVCRLLEVKQSNTTPYHAMGNGIVENFNKTIKNLLKKVAAEKPKDWHRYLGPLMFAVCDTPQDSIHTVRIVVWLQSPYTNDFVEKNLDG